MYIYIYMWRKAERSKKTSCGEVRERTPSLYTPVSNCSHSSTVAGAVGTVSTCKCSRSASWLPSLNRPTANNSLKFLEEFFQGVLFAICGGVRHRYSSLFCGTLYVRHRSHSGRAVYSCLRAPDLEGVPLKVSGYGACEWPLWERYVPGRKDSLVFGAIRYGGSGIVRCVQDSMWRMYEFVCVCMSVCMHVCVCMCVFYIVS